MKRSRIVRPLTRMYPFLSGCTFPNRRLFKQVIGTPDERRWARVRGGWVVADLDDFVGRAAYFTGDVDRKISRLFDVFVRPGDTVLDVGANIGVTTLRLSRLVGPTGQVHAFEPNPVVLTRLREGLDRSEAHNVVVHPYALGSAPGTASLRVPRANAGAGSIKTDRIPRATDSFDVPVKRLDDVVPSIGTPRLVKLDVEGAEADVLAGAAELLDTRRPEVVVFEGDPVRNQANTDRVFSTLIENGFQIFGLPKALFRMHVVPVSITAESDRHFFDFVAISTESCIDRLDVRPHRASQQREAAGA